MKVAVESNRSRRHDYHVAWCFKDESSELAEAILTRLSSLTDTALVPALWLYEVANVTELAARKGRISQEKAHAFLGSVVELPIEVDEAYRPQFFTSVRSVASQYRLTAYDDAYLELAIRHHLPLATLDAELLAAARAAGVQGIQA